MLMITTINHIKTYFKYIIATFPLPALSYRYQMQLFSLKACLHIHWKSFYQVQL